MKYRTRSSSPEEIMRVVDAHPKRYWMADFICKRGLYHYNVEKIGWKCQVFGGGKRRTIIPPYSYGDMILFKEKFKVAWWNKDFTKAIFMFSDGFSIKRDVDEGFLEPVILRQLRAVSVGKGKELKSYIPKHLVETSQWQPPVHLPNNAVRLMGKVRWFSAKPLWEIAREITDKHYIPRAEFEAEWNRRFDGVCPFHTESLAWIFHVCVEDFVRGLKNRKELNKETRLRLPIREDENTQAQ